MTYPEKEALRLANGITSTSSTEELEWAVIELSCAVLQCQFSVGEALLYNHWRRVTRLLIKKRRDAKASQT